MHLVAVWQFQGTAYISGKGIIDRIKEFKQSVISYPGSNCKTVSGICGSYGHVQVADLDAIGPGDGKMHFFPAGIDSGKGLLINEQGRFLCQGHSWKKEKKEEQEKNVLIMIYKQLLNLKSKISSIHPHKFNLSILNQFDKQDRVLTVLMIS
jgi:hypothetical protein